MQTASTRRSPEGGHEAGSCGSATGREEGGMGGGSKGGAMRCCASSPASIGFGGGWVEDADDCEVQHRPSVCLQEMGVERTDGTGHIL